jgi:hypothetical protein
MGAPQWSLTAARADRQPRDVPTQPLELRPVACRHTRRLGSGGVRSIDERVWALALRARQRGIRLAISSGPPAFASRSAT